MQLPPIVRLLRPQQWTKNLACMAGVVFGALRAHVEILTSRPSSIASLVK